MKKNILFTFALIAATAFTSCVNNANNNKKGTHTHEDGSVHEAHTEIPTTTNAKQESFKVDTTTQQEVKSKESTHGHVREHKHEDSHNHSHDHDSDHKH